jgi:hypothetical protein
MPPCTPNHPAANRWISSEVAAGLAFREIHLGQSEASGPSLIVIKF